MLRCIFNFIATASLLLFVFTNIMWIRSELHGDRIKLSNGSEFSSENGRWAFGKWTTSKAGPFFSGISPKPPVGPPVVKVFIAHHSGYYNELFFQSLLLPLFWLIEKLVMRKGH